MSSIRTRPLGQSTLDRRVRLDRPTLHGIRIAMIEGEIIVDINGGSRIYLFFFRGEGTALLIDILNKYS